MRGGRWWGGFSCETTTSNALSSQALHLAAHPFISTLLIVTSFVNYSKKQNDTIMFTSQSVSVLTCHTSTARGLSMHFNGRSE